MRSGSGTVRPIEPSDLDAVVRIDEKLSGTTRVAGYLFGWVGESTPETPAA